MCGIAGAYGIENASRIVSLMLKAMQHRGQEGAGIVSVSDQDFHVIKDFGLVDEVFSTVDFATRLPGTSAIGHLRYPTTGESRSRENIQPFTAKIRHGTFALSHNGNLTNFRRLRAAFESEGAIFRSCSDSEIFLHLLARSAHTDFSASFTDVLRKVEGAFSLVVLTEKGMLAAMDPYGFRPLVQATYGGGVVFASETCAFDLLQAEGARPVQAGEVVEVTDMGMSHARFAESQYTRHCSFEHVYFTRPDSVIFGMSANDVRERLGEELAKVSAIESDLVTAVPDSSNVVALTYAQATGMPFKFSLIRNHYTGRTFITPQQKAREFGVRVKLNAVRSTVRGKRVTVVDDSLVRGTTMRKVVQLLRDAGACAVHVLIASPPVIHPCFWGIDTPRRTELIASENPIETIRTQIHADSLHYLPLAALQRALGDPDGTAYCTTCFTGVMPVKEHIVPRIGGPKKE